MPAFKCGHEAPEPRNMGRGQARIRRLSKYFNRDCLACAEKRLKASALALSNYTPELETRWLKKLHTSY